MSKVKTKKHDTFIDMTAMSDVTVLLLTFFMLTATFIPIEPVQVFTPGSASETKVPDYDVITVIIDPAGKIYLNMDRPDNKREILERMGGYYNVAFSEKDKNVFAESTTFAAVPMGQMKTYLSKDMSDRDEMIKQLNGIPNDSINNQFAEWIRAAKDVNDNLAIAIKADQNTPYPLVQGVISKLQDIKENRFSLITTLRGMEE
ncbi:biopolymer transporter ExbD [Dysgonomonas sp. 216]|uniref:ExbD/TolR family protein n=1 Tax=Dysgonomonas sp. 216 TaxID=2302934 RepID=UPI0013D3ED3F|nr:biopolymer transporter ExbD [Dysgonomonas sp. 216]NDW17946.1 biopolymer transporter ExbD [Dysgonomonas sp. 216]